MNNEEKLLYLNKQADDSGLLRKRVASELGQQILDLAAVISGVIGAGGKILVAGNGGSAAESSHLVTELIVRLTAKRNRQSLPAISLSSDPSVITAAANDYGFENIFSRQIEGLGKKGDLLLVLSTSGNSANLINAARVAHEKELLTAALLGGNGGKIVNLVDRAIVIPHDSTQRIQEEHLFLIHFLVETVEGDLF